MHETDAPPRANLPLQYRLQVLRNALQVDTVAITRSAGRHGQVLVLAEGDETLAALTFLLPSPTQGSPVELRSSLGFDLPHPLQFASGWPLPGLSDHHVWVLDAHSSHPIHPGKLQVLEVSLSWLAHDLTHDHDQPPLAPGHRILDHLPTMVHLTDPNGLISFANRHWLARLGYQAEDVLRHSTLAFLTPESQQTYARVFPEYLRNGAIHELRVDFLTSAGEPFPVLASARTMRNQQGTLTGHYTVCSELITPRETLLPLEEELALKRGAFEHSPDAIILTDAERRVLYANDTAQRMFGYTEMELRGRSASIIYADPDAFHEAGRRIFHHHARYQTTPWRYTCKRADGTTFEAETMGGVLTDAGGHAIGFVGITRDTTERARAEKALRSSLNQVARKNRQLQVYTQAISHDLRAPLAAIHELLGWVQTDLAEGNGERASHSLRVVQDRIGQLHDTMNHLLEFAHHDASREDLEELTLTDLAQQLRSLRPLPEGFELHFDLQVDRIRTRSVPLRQVLLNLISNAVQHHDQSHGRIHVVARPLDGAVHFEVSDDGPGIKPTHRRRVFDPLVSLNTSGDPQHRGLGLALVQRMVQDAGGDVWIDDNTPRGTRMCFHWPLQEQA